MKNILIKFIIASIAITISLTACKKDKDQVSNPTPPTDEPEVMTTFKLTFIDSASVLPTVTALYRDPDGDGGNTATEFDTIKLHTNTTYLTNILILDETKSPADTTSKEIKEKANEHLFFYTITGISTSINILDYDTNTPPLPVGLQTKWKTATASNGNVRIVLRHQPGVKNGNYGPGETDIDLTFQAKVQ